MASAEKTQDRWEQAREEAKQRLLACQREQGVDSCMKCEKILGCEIRAEYVRKVYESMNKGEGGGFEF
jgi:predicted nucleic acid-binding Zn ribbon protein